MRALIAYDVNTTTPQGRARLRRIAKACEAWGQRVQNSVFEVYLNDVEYMKLVARVTAIVDADHDSLRIYPLLAASFDAVINVGSQRALADNEWVL